jgi:Kdo2-lipid IVA lauroyltransferase/acyltransferase
MIIVNNILGAFCWFLSKMPFFILYGVSDMFFVLVYYVVRYRRKVVYANLRNSFPEKTDQEIRKTARKFYRNFCDQILEIVKGRSISLEQLLKRMQYKNTELIDQLYEEGRSVVAMCGHLGNWEWLGMSFKTYVKHKGYAVVKPFSDKYWDRYIRKIRLRFPKEGLVGPNRIFLELVRHKNERTLSLIAGDQTPAKNEIEYWTKLLHQDTAFYLGSEKIAKALDMAVVFVDVQRVKRSHYQVEISLITKDPKNTADFEITEAYVKKLEKVILEHNENWLWSHRRWKHKKEN